MSLIVSSLKSVVNWLSPSSRIPSEEHLRVAKEKVVNQLGEVINSKNSNEKSPLDDKSKQYELRHGLVEKYKKANKENELFKLLQGIAFDESESDTELRAQAICCLTYFMRTQLTSNIVFCQNETDESDESRLTKKLLKLLDNNNPQMRAAAFYTLAGRTLDGLVHPALIKCLDDEDEGVQKFVISALQYHHLDPKILNALKEKLNTISLSDSTLRLKIEEAIEFMHINIQADLENDLFKIASGVKEEVQQRAIKNLISSYTKKYGEPSVRNLLSNIVRGEAILYSENENYKNQCKLQAACALEDL